MCCGGCGGSGPQSAPPTGGNTVMGVPGTNTTVPMIAPAPLPSQVLTAPVIKAQPDWWVVLLIGVAVGYVVNS